MELLLKVCGGLFVIGVVAGITFGIWLYFDQRAIDKEDERRHADAKRYLPGGK